MPFFSKVFKPKDGRAASSRSRKDIYQNDVSLPAPPKQTWDDAWVRPTVEPEEVQDLLRGCTLELKSRGLELPFLLLPFRPASDPSAARSFVRNYFKGADGRAAPMDHHRLEQELRLTEPTVLCSVVKWCWSRLPGGVVTWEAYELFRIGEQDSQMARDSFATFVPLSVDSDARSKIIFDFFDLMAAIAAHGKSNGLGGRKLSRLAGWWAFEHADNGDGFDGGYKSWMSAADATSHLFFAYLRSLSPDSVRGVNGISTLPLSLQTLVQATEYPPETPFLMQTTTPKVVMIVDTVSPTPFSLLRRAKHFEYRDDDPILQSFANFEDPIDALTEECSRVLRSISSTNQSQVSTSKASTSLRDASWSRFEDIGFSSLMEEPDKENKKPFSNANGRPGPPHGLSSTPRSRVQDAGRPTTPSWADFLSAGFVDEGTRGPAPLMLPPDKILPPINTSGSRGGQSDQRMAEAEPRLEPGELASINKVDLDDCFWWVWITSLAGEEPTDRKGVFGRCALIETRITGGRWLIIEEKVKGAAPEPEEGAYIVEKKSRFGITKRGRMTRNKSSNKKIPAARPQPAPYRSEPNVLASKTSVGPDQHARIQAAAAALQQKQKPGEGDENPVLRRARTDDAAPTRTNSVFTLQPVILSEAAPAMKWANKFDKDAIRAAYLGDNLAGTGSERNLPMLPQSNGNGVASTPDLPKQPSSNDRELPALPKGESGLEANREESKPATPAFATAAPLPPTPQPATEQNVELGSEAAQLPLPADAQPPASLHDGVTEPQHPATRAAEASDDRHDSAVPSQGSTPEKKKGNKLKKGVVKGKENRGFRKMFRKKTEDVPSATASPKPAEDRPSLKTPQSTSSLGRRMSNYRKKSAPDATPPLPKPPVDDVDHDAPVSPVSITPVHSRQADHVPETSPPISQDTPSTAIQDRAYESETIPIEPAYNPPSSFTEPTTSSAGPAIGSYEPQLPSVGPAMASQAPQAYPAQPRMQSQEPPTRFKESKRHSPPLDPKDEREAAQAFKSFDDSPHEEATGPAPGTAEYILAHSIHHQPAPAPGSVSAPAPTQVPTQAPFQAPMPVQSSSPVSTPAPAPVRQVEPDQEPDQSLDLTREASPAQGRWAQIRQNAARRAAAKESEEPPARPSHSGRTEDGETSGEETIESRVARIKARVAELTGNMEGEQNGRPMPK